MKDNNKKNTGQEIYYRAKQIIPGGTQLFGKKPELYLPELWPAYYSKANGCEIWDMDGKRYLDFTMVGIGTSVLGYADKDINKAVMNAIDGGNLTTLNAPEEVELAEMLLQRHSWAEMVRYARSGGEVMAIAIRIARAASKKNKIAFCGYHGWHDWYLSANISNVSNLDKHLLPKLEPRGVPEGLQNLMYPFEYNNINSLKSVIMEQGEDIGIIVMEPCRDNGPDLDFLKEVREIATDNNIILIFDEITSGFREIDAGMHMLYGIYPDICAFGKTISNGIPMAALIGVRKVMEAAETTFISSTYWTDRAGPSAAIAFLNKYSKLDVGSRLLKIGKKLQKGFKLAAKNSDLNITISGIPQLTAFKLEVDDWPAVLTLYTQKMLEQGFLSSDRCYANFAHTDEYIEDFISSVNKVFAFLKKAIDDNQVRSELNGPVKTMGFNKV
jgi:glutamate-1-semialdehyde 2,1-aminomutase